MKELLLRTVTGISLIILVPGSILLGALPFLGMLILVYGLSCYELLALFPPAGKIPRLIMVTGAGMIIPALFMLLHLQRDPLWLVIPVVIWMIGYFWAGLPGSGLLALFWLAVPYALFYASGWINDAQQYRSLLPLSSIAMVWINDTFAYLVGSLLGKHQMTPRLSPGKTWEGLAGGALFTVLGGWIFFMTAGRYSIRIWLVLSGLVVLFGLAGDLLESHLKRKKKVKDTGRLLPGHGGVLDRFDSLLLVAPVIFIFMLILIQLS